MIPRPLRLHNGIKEPNLAELNCEVTSVGQDWSFGANESLCPVGERADSVENATTVVPKLVRQWHAERGGKI